MFRSLRGRLSLLATSLVALSVGSTAGAAVFLFSLGEVSDPQLRIGVLVAGATSFLALVLIAIATMGRALQPLEAVAQAGEEIVSGRHPDEALAGTGATGELASITESFRVLSLRLREISSSDRRFLMSITHELRTPLTAIAGHAELLDDDVADDPAIRSQSITVIRREAARLDRLVEDIIDLSRLRSNRFTTVTESLWLDELGEHLLDVVGDRGDSGVLVVGQFEHELFTSDGQRILQILRNLINNGVRYASSEVAVVGERIGGRIILRVTNDGPAIPEAARDRIFEPFIGTKREGGLGLGLAIGRELAWALGGNLECLPADDGARFDLTLPVEPPHFGR